VAIAAAEGGPFFSGTFDEVLEQKYPLSRLIYIYINCAPAKPVDPNVRAFLMFVLSREGQQDVVKEGIFLPLPTSIVMEELAKIK